MGQRSSLVSVQSYPYVWIERPKCLHVFTSSKQFDSPKPPELIHIDEILWQHFSSEINQFVPVLNVGLRTLGISHFVILFVFVSLLAMASLITSEDRSSFNFWSAVKYGRFILIFLLILGYFRYGAIIRKNRHCDEQIKQVCEKYKSQFEGKGVSIEYKTEHTGLCKPKHAVPARIIFFPPVEVPEHQVESKTNNDYAEADSYIDSNNNEKPTNLGAKKKYDGDDLIESWLNTKY